MVFLVSCDKFTNRFQTTINSSVSVFGNIQLVLQHPTNRWRVANEPIALKFLLEEKKKKNRLVPASDKRMTGPVWLLGGPVRERVWCRCDGVDVHTFRFGLCVREIPGIRSLPAGPPVYYADLPGSICTTTCAKLTPIETPIPGRTSIPFMSTITTVKISEQTNLIRFCLWENIFMPT